MSSRVEKLQALLQRVQRNRVGHQPPRQDAVARDESQSAPLGGPGVGRQAEQQVVGGPGVGRQAGEEAVVAAPRVERRVPSHPPGETHGSMEDAMKRVVSAAPPQQPEPAQAAPPQQPTPPPTAAARPAPPRAPEAERIAPYAPAEPTSPIASAVSQQPAPVAPSFAELVRRTLSLRLS